MEQHTTFEEKWRALESQWEERFGKVPNMEALLFLIGVNEYKGRMPKYRFSKEEKQDLMHIGTCVLLQQYGYYRFTHYDEEGWPHFEKINDLHSISLKEQESLLRTAIVSYFEETT